MITVMFITTFLVALVMLVCYDVNPALVALFLVVFGELLGATGLILCVGGALVCCVCAKPKPPLRLPFPSPRPAPLEGLFLSSNAIKIPEGGWWAPSAGAGRGSGGEAWGCGPRLRQGASVQLAA